MKVKLCLLFCIISIFGAAAQGSGDSTYDRKKGINKFGPIRSHFEATANVTTVISRFSGNLTRAMEEDPYLVAFKYYFAKPRIAVRLGMNGDYSKDAKSAGTANIETLDKKFMPLIGFELRRVVSSRFEVYTGLDFRYYKTYSWLKTTDNMDFSELTAVSEGYGVGPNFGFTFFLTKNIRLFTEANLYVNFFDTKRTLYTNSAGMEVLENSSSLRFKPVVPASLFLSICF